MGEVKVEQLGGFVGFGGPHMKSWGTVNLSSLSQGDRAALERLFELGKRSAIPPANPTISDQFRYRITRSTATGSEVIEAPESEVPEVLRACVTVRLE